jgi:hypothetical protein
MNPPLQDDRKGDAMLTSAECRAQAEQKLAQAQRDDRNRKRLILAAEAWLFLAGQLRRAERALALDETSPNDEQSVA